MRAYKLSKRAEQCLAAIYRCTYLQFGENQADQYMLELDAVFETIADYPKIGRIYSGKTRFLYMQSILFFIRFERIIL